MKISRGRKFLYLAVALLGMAVLVELGARTVALATGRGFFENPDFKYTSPFFTTAWPPQPQVDGEDLDFHGDRLTRRKPEDEIRILCLGGSTTVNQRFGRSYAAILEERLDPAFPAYRLRVVRAASHAYTTAHALVNFSLRCLEAQPDIITIYHAANDASVNNYGDRVAPDYGNKYMTSPFQSYHHRTGVWSGLMKVSRVARHLEKNFLAAWQGVTQRGSTAQDLNGVVYFERNLRSLVAVARAHGVRVVLATQAGRSDERSKPRFAVYNDAVKRLAAELDVPWVDAASDVREDDLFVDRLHYTNAGLDAVATAFEPILREQVADVVADRGGPGD